MRDLKPEEMGHVYGAGGSGGGGGHGGKDGTSRKNTSQRHGNKSSRNHGNKSSHGRKGGTSRY